MLDAKAATDSGFSGLAAWMRRAEAQWNDHSANNLTLIEQFDYYGKLGSQFPTSLLRVTYAASGTNPAACVIRNSDAVVEHGLYWARPDSEDEAYYLCS
ncbi:MAG: hypothetical protein ACR2FH_08845, partial [Caulobacteraceae bacterium]